MNRFFVLFACAALLASCAYRGPCPFRSPLPEARDLAKANRHARTRWASFENPTAGKGIGGKENLGAKGHAFDAVKAGQTVTLLDVKGCGTVRRIWMTMNPRDPRLMREMRIQMYWDGADKPAVSAPLGDFFGALFGRHVPFENELFANPEGRSFNCYIPMPFRKSARITLTNDSARDMTHLFYDVDVVMQDVPHSRDTLYFHAAWRRDRLTTLGQDYEILPKVTGTGRFLGAHITYQVNPLYEGWWGEGQVKMYLDGDRDLPTLVNTGTEDYPGSGWGQDIFKQHFQGGLVADAKRGQYGFYRYHIPDPVYFQKDCRVTLAQIGGYPKAKVVEMMKKGRAIKPVTADQGGGGHFLKILDANPPVNFDKDINDGDWLNYYRQDDVSAVAYFYLDSPQGTMKDVPSKELRLADIPEKNPDEPQ